MIPRGPFQSLTFCDSVIILRLFMHRALVAQEYSSVFQCSDYRLGWCRPTLKPFIRIEITEKNALCVKAKDV